MLGLFGGSQKFVNDKVGICVQLSDFQGVGENLPFSPFNVKIL